RHRGKAEGGQRRRPDLRHLRQGGRLANLNFVSHLYQQREVITASVTMRGMRVSAKEDYAIRAALEIAVAPAPPVKRDRIAEAQDIPTAFLENILLDLKRAEIVETQRGPDGGFRLARPA